MNTATVKKSDPGGSCVPISGTGKCLEAFLDELKSEHGKDVEISVHQTAQDVIQYCVDTYTSRFGPGDVGAKGTGLVSHPFKPSGGELIPNRTTGLLYGKVQSGKTNAAIASVALALENGFRCMVVLTSDNVLLGNQTLERFVSSLTRDGPIVRGWTEFASDPVTFGRALKANRRFVEDGVVLVSTKNAAHLASLQTVLKAAGAAGFPSIVIDDEADQASLNTRNARNAAKGTDEMSKIFELIGDIRKAIPNHVFLQVTATPASLLLQSLEHPSKPVFCVLVPPGKAYIGGNEFFSDLAASKERRVEVDPAEIGALKGGAIIPGGKTAIPNGLRLALCTFFIGAAEKQLKLKRKAHYTFLIHISHLKPDFKYISTVVQDFTTLLEMSLRGKKGPSREAEALKWLKAGFDEVSKTCKTLSKFDDLVKELEHSLKNVNPIIVDADAKNSDIKYRDGMNILIGGNRMGRGLTIDGLMVVYYGRDPKTPMGDTVHQHARMFGYRQNLLDSTRIFSAPHLLDGFRTIHESDEATRSAIGEDPRNLQVKPVWVGKTIKATRSNVLNPADIGAITPGKTIYPPDPHWKKADTDADFKALDKLLAPFSDDKVYHQVKIEKLIEILKHMRSKHIPGYSWEHERILEVLKALSSDPVGIKTGRLNVRRGPGGRGLNLARQDPPWQGFVDSAWEKEAKGKYGTEPTLIVMMQAGEKSKRWEGSRVYVPTLILPSSKFVFMFNFT
jgi:hypothetical protein